jgi:hypothetical protein
MTSDVLAATPSTADSAGRELFWMLALMFFFSWRLSADFAPHFCGVRI